MEKFLRTLIEPMKEYFTVNFLVLVAITIGKILAFYIIYKIAEILLIKSIRQWGKKSKADRSLEVSFGQTTVHVIFWIFFIITVLVIFGINMTPLIASLGAATFVIGLAFQETLGNLLSGIMILFKKPFRVGDYVDFHSTASGTITDIDMIGVTLKTPDGKKVIINNKAAWGNTITNYSFVEQRGVTMSVGVAYGSNIDNVKKVIHDVLSSYDEVIKDVDILIEVNSLSASSVDFLVRPSVKPADYWSVYWRFQKDIYNALNKANISIPFPQMDVHVKKDL